MNKIRKDDEIIVIAGKDKGKRGKVLRAITKNKTLHKVVVEGVNIIKKHVKPNPNTNTEGGIVEREAPLAISNIALYNHVSGKPDKVGFKFLEQENRKVRYFKSNGELIDL
jgi:large subunit ribosomal protein L24